MGKEVRCRRLSKTVTGTYGASCPSQMSREEVEGDGRRKTEGGRGQVSNPQREGTRKCLQMEPTGSREQTASVCLEHSAEAG